MSNFNKKMKKFKKIKEITIVLSCCLLLASCERSSVVNKFVGIYSISATWNMSVIIDGKSYSVVDHQTMKSYLTISKTDDKDVVDVSEAYETTAKIQGNTITLNPVQGTSSNADQGSTEVLNINFQSGKLEGNTLKFNANITGTHYQNGEAYPVVGDITHTARKLS